MSSEFSITNASYFSFKLTSWFLNSARSAFVASEDWLLSLCSASTVALAVVNFDLVIPAFSAIDSTCFVTDRLRTSLASREVLIVCNNVSLASKYCSYSFSFVF